MKWPTLYIVPTDLLETLHRRSEEDPGLGAIWGAMQVPGDPTKALLDVAWEENPNGQIPFESLPGVLPLGLPWGPLPAEAVPLLASFKHFSEAYAEAYTLDPATAQAAAYASAKAQLDSAVAAMAPPDPATVSIATIAGPEVAEGDSVARGVHIATGRRFW
jgi:hypothetical protein